MEGNGVVEVKIVTPNSMSRTLVDATPGNNGDEVQVKGTMSIKLTAVQEQQHRQLNWMVRVLELQRSNSGVFRILPRLKLGLMMVIK